MSFLWKAFTRRKPIDKTESESKLKRCLNTVDLTALGLFKFDQVFFLNLNKTLDLRLGVGSTLGVGVYVITGTVAANSAGN